MKDKAQMEIMGLAIIVILITIGMLFAIGMLNPRPPPKGPETKALANSFLNTFLGTTTECKGSTFRVLVQDCAQSLAIPCPGMNSCEYIETKLDEFLDQTLVEMQKTHHIFFSGGPRIEDISLGDPEACELLEREQAEQYIPLRGAGTVTVTLRICG